LILQIESTFLTLLMNITPGGESFSLIPINQCLFDKNHLFYSNKLGENVVNLKNKKRYSICKFLFPLPRHSSLLISNV